MRGERELIERIARAFGVRLRKLRGRGVRLGIGDDAALVRPSPGKDLVLTCDAFLENVHFLPNLHPADAVGFKALARATSDLAAMGARPHSFLLTLALPANRTGRWLDHFLAGMARAARQFGLVLIGGDTARHSTVAVSITVLGEVAPGYAMTRASACPGDLIFVSGTLGAAQLGLEFLLSYRRLPAGSLRRLQHQRRMQRLLLRHLYPEPRLQLGEMLARRGLASAMIDTSDGLSTDLTNLCSASGVGAELWQERLPIVGIPDTSRPFVAPASSRRFESLPLALALHGGEDYELLFTVPRRKATSLPRTFARVPLTCIGRITRQRGTLLIQQNGHAMKIAPRGWDHFVRE